MEAAEGRVLVWGAQVPSCLGQEQLEREEKRCFGLGHHLHDPVQPLPFTLSMEHSKPVTGEGSGQYFGQESKKKTLKASICFNHSTGGLVGASVQMCGLGNEKGEDVADTGKGKGKFGLQLYCVLSQKFKVQYDIWLQGSLPWLPKCFLPRCSAAGRELLWEHRVRELFSC